MHFPLGGGVLHKAPRCVLSFLRQLAVFGKPRVSSTRIDVIPAGQTHWWKARKHTVLHSPNLGPSQRGGHRAGEAGTLSWILFQLCFGTSPIFKNKRKCSGEREQPLNNSRKEDSGGMWTCPISAFFMVKICHEWKRTHFQNLSLSLFLFNST